MADSVCCLYVLVRKEFLIVVVQIICSSCIVLMPSSYFPGVLLSLPGFSKEEDFEMQWEVCGCVCDM